MGQKFLGRRQRLKWEKRWEDYRRPRPILDMRMEEDGFHIIFYPIRDEEQTNDEYSEAQMKEKRNPVMELCAACRRFPNDPSRKNSLRFLIYETQGRPIVNWDAIDRVIFTHGIDAVPLPMIKVADEWEVKKYAPRLESPR